MNNRPMFVSNQDDQLEVELETPTESRKRRMRNLVMGPTAPLLVFAGSLVIFAIEEWRLGRERAQRQEEAKQARIAEIKGLSHDVVEAAKRYIKYRKKIEGEPGWQKQDLRERLEDIWCSLFTLQGLQDHTARLLAGKDFPNAAMLADLARERSPDNTLSRALQRLSKKSKTTPKQTVEACLTMDRYYANYKGEGVDDVRKTVVIRLVDLIDQGYLKVVADELVDYEYVHDLLGEPEFEQPLLDRKKEEEAQKLINIRWESRRLPGLWPAAPLTVDPPVAQWLREVDLTGRSTHYDWFNPFGPERAEMDPYLKDYEVQAVFEGVLGKRPVIVFGPSGSGKTGAALLIDWYCKNSPSSLSSLERGANIFSVYHTPPTDIPRVGAQIVHLEAMIQATAEAIMRYLTRRRGVFLTLTPPDRYNIARLISLCMCSPTHLEAELQRTGPVWGTSRRLIDELVALYQEIPRNALQVQDYLSLLSGVKTINFDCVYLLVDLSVAASCLPAPEKARNLQSLLDLIVPLAAQGIYLKLFFSEALRRYLGDLPDCKVMSLTWERHNLETMLENRLRRAGGESLSKLCVPPNPEVDRLLVKVAKDSPRRLIRIGNTLLEEARSLQQPGSEPQLAADRVMRFLEAWEESND
jgi:hypothetical protein